jgi:TPR repeat protein
MLGRARRCASRQVTHNDHRTALRVDRELMAATLNAPADGLAPGLPAGRGWRAARHSDPSAPRPPAAVVWFREAAERGHVIAQRNLGLMYANGQGVPQDYLLAHMWFNLAASGATDASTRGTAVKSRDLVAARMTPPRSPRRSGWPASGRRATRRRANLRHPRQGVPGCQAGRAALTMQRR